MNKEGISHLLNWWRACGNQFSKHRRIVKDMLAIQGFLVALEETLRAIKVLIQRPHIFNKIRKIRDFGDV